MDTRPAFWCGACRGPQHRTCLMRVMGVRRMRAQEAAGGLRQVESVGLSLRVMWRSLVRRRGKVGGAPAVRTPQTPRTTNSRLLVVPLERCTMFQRLGLGPGAGGFQRLSRPQGWTPLSWSPRFCSVCGHSPACHSACQPPPPPGLARLLCIRLCGAVSRGWGALLPGQANPEGHGEERE